MALANTMERTKMANVKIVVVGGVAAGASAAAKARRCSEEAEIIIFEKGPFISYANCGLPYYLSGTIAKRESLLVVDPPFLQQRFNIQAKTSHEVLAIDRAAKQVTVRDLTRDHTFCETYDKLILAPGASPVVPPVPGVDLPFVFTAKTLDDTDRIFTLMEEQQPRRAVVIGGGLIGMEMAENLVARGIETTVVEFLSQVLPFLDAEMAEQVHRHCDAKKLCLLLGEKVSAIRQTASGGQVITEAGAVIPADLVIIAVGVRPNVDLARQAGLVLGVTGGIKVDALMQTSDPAILAAGDCVETINLVTAQPALMPMAAAANKGGRAAGANALGRAIRMPGAIGTAIVKVFDLTVAVTGLSERQAVAAGFTPSVAYVIGLHHAGYYPGGQSMELKTITCSASGRLLGAQIVGRDGVDKRIDVLACAIHNHMRTEDLIHLDLAYAPPFSSARDLVMVAGALAQNFSNGDWQPITPVDLQQRIKAQDTLTVVDVRTEPEVKRSGVIPGARHIPVDAMRERLGELDPQEEIVLYCGIGLRSYVASRILTLHGFPRVKTLTGGVTAWPYGLDKGN
jgi:NADPH-dependent 2,4-dienoyl-CoA reductase/sulfur reductase-like enzyme/rhodanese-related sulfurtransferase